MSCTTTTSRTEVAEPAESIFDVTPFIDTAIDASSHFLFRPGNHWKEQIAENDVEV